MANNNYVIETKDLWRIYMLNAQQEVQALRGVTLQIDPGRFVAFIGTSPENLGRAVDGLRREIARIVEEPVEIDELEMAKSYLTGSFVFKFQTNAQIASYLVEAEIFDLGFDFLERYPRLVGEVSIDEVLRVAREHIDPNAMTLVVVGPEGS